LLCWFSQLLHAAEPFDVSLVQLVAKVVRVIGFVRLAFEGNAIYLQQEDYKHGITKNGLWIDATDEIWKRRADFDRKYVLLEGTFSANDTGPMGTLEWQHSEHYEIPNLIETVMAAAPPLGGSFRASLGNLSLFLSPCAFPLWAHAQAWWGSCLGPYPLPPSVQDE
jgi:hypothetical protein